MSLTPAELAYLNTLTDLPLPVVALAYHALDNDVPMTAVHMDITESVTGGGMAELDNTPIRGRR